MIPAVPRRAGGIRNHREGDLRWVEQGPSLSGARVCAARPQGGGRRQRPAGPAGAAKRSVQGLERLNFKIARYGDALKTGALNWTKEEN